MQHQEIVHHNAVSVGHEDAFAHTGFQHTGVFQRTKSFAEGRAAHAEHIRKLAFGREAIPAFEFSLDQQFLDLLNDLPRNGAFDNFIEHIPLFFESKRLMTGPTVFGRREKRCSGPPGWWRSGMLPFILSEQTGRVQFCREKANRAIFIKHIEIYVFIVW